jgi:hypothetical protein
VRARRRPVIDEYEQDGEAAVFVDGNVVVLSPLATHLLRLLCEDGWTDVDTLAADLVEAFGPPPDDPIGVSTTAKALGSLDRLNIVELGN